MHFWTTHQHQRPREVCRPCWLSIQSTLGLFLKKQYLFIYLAVLCLNCKCVGSEFPGQASNLGTTPPPLHWECRVLATGLPGKSLPDIFEQNDFGKGRADKGLEAHQQTFTLFFVFFLSPDNLSVIKGTFVLQTIEILLHVLDKVNRMYYKDATAFFGEQEGGSRSRVSWGMRRVWAKISENRHGLVLPLPTWSWEEIKKCTFMKKYASALLPTSMPPSLTLKTAGS